MHRTYDSRIGSQGPRATFGWFGAGYLQWESCGRARTSVKLSQLRGLGRFDGKRSFPSTLISDRRLSQERHDGLGSARAVGSGGPEEWRRSPIPVVEVGLTVNRRRLRRYDSRRRTQEAGPGFGRLGAGHLAVGKLQKSANSSEAAPPVIPAAWPHHPSSSLSHRLWR